MGELTSLEVLSLEGNSLSGEVPKELGKLERLEILRIAGNRLTGEIPKDLTKLAELRTMLIGGNGFEGCVPARLRRVAINDFKESELGFCEAEDDNLPELCSFGIAIADPVAEPGLAADCGVLLTIRDELGGALRLNWSAFRPMSEWEGVVVEGSPSRVKTVRVGVIRTWTG